MKADREQAERVADPDSLSESERAELKRLRKENAQLDASRDSVEGGGDQVGVAQTCAPPQSMATTGSSPTTQASCPGGR